MRLTRVEVSSIRAVMDDFIIGLDAELFLYGSRLDDTLKGGDIDLMLVLNDDLSRDSLLKRKYRLLVMLKQAIGDQRIDLSILSRLETQQPFYAACLKQALSLAQWKA